MERHWITRRSCGAPFGPSASPMFASASCLRSPACPGMTNGGSKLRKNFPHRGIVALVVRSGLLEAFIEHLQTADLRHVEQRLGLRSAFQLVRAQQFGAAEADAVALRLDQSRDAVIDEAQAALLANGAIDRAHGHWASFPLVRFACNLEW